MQYTITIIIFLTITLSGCGDSSGRYELSSSIGGEIYVLDTKDGTLWIALTERAARDNRYLIENMSLIKLAKIPKNTGVSQ